jgi:DNA-binding response OmpR family regulator
VVANEQPAAALIKVLVVDDELPVRLVCRLNLEAEGMVVLEAADGWAALEQAHTGQPSIILLDVMLPGLDGWQVADELIRDPRTGGIPIVFMSALAEFRDRAHGIGIGGVDYVTKPFDPTELGQILRSVLERVERGELEDLRREKLEQL